MGTRTPGVQAALAGLGPGARVLDAACGVGIDAASLARRGFRVVAADASEAMVARARGRLGAGIPVVCCRWEDLPTEVPGPFDAVLCTGSSLAHAPDAVARREALAAFAAVLAPGGALILDAQDWEVVHAAGSRLDPDPLVVERDGVRCTRTYRWEVPAALHAVHRLTIELALDDGASLRHSRHTVALHPFTTAELEADLAATGFTAVERVQVPGDDRWSATARRS